MNPLPGLRVLEALPAVFSRSHLEQRLPAEQAGELLVRWLHSAHVEALGGRSDVFANRHMAAHPDWDSAVRLAAPSAVIAGTEALRRAGWITQIPQRPEVAVPAVEAALLQGVDRFDVLVRPEVWFATVFAALPESGAAAPTLPPAWALADLLATEGWGRSGVAPADLSFDEVVDQDRTQWRDACRAFGLVHCELESVGRKRTEPASSNGHGV